MIVLGFNPNMLSMIIDNAYSNGITRLRVLDNSNNFSEKKALQINHPSVELEFIETLPIDKSLKLFYGYYKPISKRTLIEQYKDLNEMFINSIHNNAEISRSTLLGRGVLINVNTCIAGNSIIRDFVSINRGVNIGHHTEIGSFSTVNPGVTICGRIHIGEGATIGASATILEGIKIGKNAVVAAGAVVVDDVPDNVLVMGIPARIVKTIL